MAVIRLVDIHGAGGVPEGVQYIGRAGRNGSPARSPLSNPFAVEQHGAHALRLYRLHIVEAMAIGEPSIVRELARLEEIASEGDLVLGCWCCSRPAHIEGLGGLLLDQRCHGDIVATAVTHWSTRLATFARARSDEDYAGPERWAAWVKREHGRHAHAVLAWMFGTDELRALAEAAEAPWCADDRLATRRATSRAIAAGMPAWMQR